MMNRKWLTILVLVVVTGALLVWLFKESSKPLPGEGVGDLGRDHVEAGKEVSYNSNPPTSGPHYADWIRSGVYKEPRDDRYLVHSLEHGYVIMSYNCGYKENALIRSVYAHGIEEESTPSAIEATVSATLPSSFRSDECHSLVDQLIVIYENKGKKKLIVIPRPNLDSRLALTAWGYIDKFDEFDEARIGKFIDSYLNQGPEKTVE